LPEAVRHWSNTTLRDRLVKIGATRPIRSDGLAKAGLAGYVLQVKPNGECMNWLAAAALMLAWCGFAGVARAGTDKTGEAVAKVEEQGNPAAGIAALEGAVPRPRQEDVRSIDAIMVAIYASISGPAGARDWERFRALMVPAGRLTESTVDAQGRTTVRQWSVEGFIAETTPLFARQPFYEKALVNKVQRFGNIAQVFTSYASRSAPNAKPFQRGINSMQLMYDGKRWWVLSILWDIDRPGNALPKAMGG
jgi:hypothetical protein